MRHVYFEAINASQECIHPNCPINTETAISGRVLSLQEYCNLIIVMDSYFRIDRILIEIRSERSLEYQNNLARILKSS